MTSRHLVVRAGTVAAARLRAEGFRPELVDTLVGASGGPKWLVLRHLDDVLAERVVRDRSTPLDTLGSSIGSFRHACLAQSDPRAATARFAAHYVGQVYSSRRPTMEEISRESERILEGFLGPKGTGEIVSNPIVRSHVIATRPRRKDGRDRGLAFQAELAWAATLNLLSRRLLENAFSRVLFETGDPAGGGIAFDDFGTERTRLSEANLRQALLASGSIPLVMAGVRSVDGVRGTLFDGGIIDYHFDFRFRRRKGLVLFPHFFDRITPGWFDKALPWRRPAARDLEDVVMVAPSDEFVASLPGGRVPDRNDFLELDTRERIRRWNDVMDRCRILADEFNDLLEGDRLAEAIEPHRSGA
ncbi:MAG TPA: hypothetical protein ENI85_19480 [Deltaproteobacteria bacterium]|nr:hypothetical protein [Deltaproteobacteria bacterium]